MFCNFKDWDSISVNHENEIWYKATVSVREKENRAHIFLMWCFLHAMYLTSEAMMSQHWASDYFAWPVWESNSFLHTRCVFELSGCALSVNCSHVSYFTIYSVFAKRYYLSGGALLLSERNPAGTPTSCNKRTDYICVLGKNIALNKHHLFI